MTRASKRQSSMDCRVEPGNDDVGAVFATLAPEREAAYIPLRQFGDSP
jgi:hypothetical protein